MDAGKLHQAAIRVNAETQAKVGRRDITETALFNQVFSLDEPKIEGSVTWPTRSVDWAAGAGTSPDGSITVAEHPRVHRPSSQWPGIGYPGDSTLRGAHHRLCAHSQLRLVVSADNWQVSMVSWSGRGNDHGYAVRHQNNSPARPI
jgi:hypothetical protein